MNAIKEAIQELNPAQRKELITEILEEKEPLEDK